MNKHYCKEFLYYSLPDYILSKISDQDLISEIKSEIDSDSILSNKENELAEKEIIQEPIIPIINQKAVLNNEYKNEKFQKSLSDITITFCNFATVQIFYEFHNFLWNVLLCCRCSIKKNSASSTIYSFDTNFCFIIYSDKFEQPFGK